MNARSEAEELAKVASLLDLLELDEYDVVRSKLLELSETSALGLQTLADQVVSLLSSAYLLTCSYASFAVLLRRTPADLFHKTPP